MSTSRRRLEVELTGNVSGFMAAMNRVLAGTSRMGQGFRQGSRDAGVFEKQIMAIGTTARYALAGQLVFGITGAISKLADFKAELGTIDSLAGQISSSGHFTSIGGQLDDVGTQAVLMSNKLGIAVGDIEQYMQRFYSSFQRPGGMSDKQWISQMSSFVNRVGMLQAQMGSEAGDPQQLAGGIAGLIHSTPGATKNLGASTARVANLISFLTAQTPNITGRDIARDIGRVGATQTIARMTPEQAFAIWGVAGMSGGSASVIGRGIAQLTGSSLMHPNTPKQKAAYLAAGLPADPTSLRALGGFTVLEKMLASVGSVKLNKRQRSILGDENIDDATANSQLGINLTSIYNMLGRQESVRQFVNILGQGGVKALQDYIKHQQLAIKADQQRERYQAAASQRVLTRFAQARSNVGMTLVAGAAPILEYGIADPVIGASNFLAKHRTTTQIGVGLGAGLAGINVLRRLGGKKGGIFGRLGGMQSAAVGAAISAEELPAVMAGGQADGSRANPFWVIISPMSAAVGGMPTEFGTPTPGGGGTMSRFTRFGKWLGGGAAAGARGLGIAGGATVAAAASIPWLWHEALGMFDGTSRAVPAGHPLLAKYANLQPRSDGIYLGGLTNPEVMSKAVQNILDRFATGKLGADRAEALLKGQMTMDIDINAHHPDGTVSKTRKRGVPVRLQGARTFPMDKGKAGSRKGGQ